MKVFAVLKKLYFIVALAFLPCALLFPLLWMEPFRGWDMGTALYYGGILPFCLLPLFLSYVELGAFVGRLTDGRTRTRGEMRFGFLTMGVAVVLAGATVAVYIPFDSMALSMALLILYAVALVALPMLWIMGALIYRKKLHFSAIMTRRSVWMPALLLCLFLLCCVAGRLFLSRFGDYHIGGKPDPLA